MGCDFAKVEEMKSTFTPGQWFPINCDFIKVGLGWDFHKGQTFDLDASVTAFDEWCDVVESIYFKNLKGLNGSIQHHGDNLTGKGDGDDEVISIYLNTIPLRIQSLAIAINSFKKNNIIEAKSAYIRIFDGDNQENEFGRFILNRTKSCIGLLLGLLERMCGGWYFRVMVDPIEGNVITKSHESLRILIGGYVSSIKSEMKENYNKKHPLPGESLFSPETWIDINYELINVGLGWDILPGNIYDLDASIISFDKKINVIEMIYHKNMKSKDGSLILLGDNRTGIGDGDDEVLSINLGNMNKNVASLAVIVNSYKENTMVGLKSAFIRLFHDTKLIGCHVLGKGGENVGLLLGVFRKNFDKKTWQFQVLISPLPGKEAPESIEKLREVMKSLKSHK